MTTTEYVEYVNENYDRAALTFIFTATLLVAVLVGGLVLLGATSPSWLLLPASWWVGGMMVWGQGKYMRTKANK